MTDTRIIAGAVTRTIAVGRGVATVVLTDTDGTRATTRTYRSNDDQLDVLGALQALLTATKSATAGHHVEIRTPAHVVEAIARHLETGAVTIPDATHQLTAIARRHQSATSAGVTISYVPGHVELRVEDQDQLDTLTRTEEQAADNQARTPWTLPAADAAWVKDNDATIVYTDGSHMAQTGFGSWAWWVDHTHHDSGTASAVTSTYVERRAIHEALRTNQGAVLIVTDISTVLPHGAGRTQFGGHTRLLKKLRAQIGRGNVRILTVKGHTTCPGNLAVDRLAGRTLAQTWSRLTTDHPQTAQHLIELGHRRHGERKRLRAEAGIRNSRRYDAEKAHQEKKFRERAAAQTTC